ncbi:mannitol-1-phosphate 5-dehydrogenase, partial [Mesorhizobium sp. M00.F.Ca.ET.186.01.1.1]
DLAPYIERKLFTVNTGHAVIAYMGYQLGITTIDQAMQNEKVAKAARGALQETGALLTAKYGFDAQAHEQYIEKILGRFANPLLSDDVVRVGRSPLRKLSRHDRLVGPALECMDRGISPEHLGMAIAAALLFDYPQDEEAARIQSNLKLYGWEYALHNCTGIPAGHPLEEVVRRQARLMQEWTSTK